MRNMMNDIVEKITVNINNVKNYKEAKKIVKSLKRIQRKNKTNFKEISSVILEQIVPDIQLKEDIINSIKALEYNNRKERYEYIYDTACKYLDDQFSKRNLCEFENDVCKAKRNCISDRNKTNGCCHEFKYLSLSTNEKTCKYLKDKHCEARCLSCKLFTCDDIDVKFRIRDILILDCFLDSIQKIVVKLSIFTPKDKVISRILRV